jgi:multidrug efflux system membrane fusion protein
MLRISPLSGLALVGLLLAGCGKPAPEAGAPPAPELPVASPLQQKVTDWDIYTARVEATDIVDVRSRVGGYLSEVAFKDGDYVQKGTLLFVIDTRPYEAEVKRAAGVLEQARAQFGLAKLEYDRAASLRQKSVISSEEHDSKKANLTQANAAIQSSEAALDTATLDLEFCRIHAPISGRVGRAMVTVGNLVQPAEKVLTTIASQDPMYVYFNADENSYLRYQALLGKDGWGNGKMPVGLERADEKNFPHTGTLDFVDNRIDPSTGTIRMRGVFENKEGLLTSGLFARVRVPASEEYEALLIPDSAIGNDQGQNYVLVVDDKNTVQNRPVEIGPLYNGLRIIRSGLQPEDRIALSGLMVARPGTVIQPKPTEIKPPVTQPTVDVKVQQ